MSPATAGKPSRRATVPGEITEQWLTLLAEKAPDEFRALVRARLRLEWADLIAQIIGHLSGLAALAILATISWHAIDRGAATQGASIICTGAVSIVAVFVTGRLTSGYTRNARGGRKESSEQDSPWQE